MSKELNETELKTIIVQQQVHIFELEQKLKAEQKTRDLWVEEALEYWHAMKVAKGEAK